MCGRTASFLITAQRSVPFSASGGHQSLHIAAWMLLQTKEEDLGCQFLLTLCKVAWRQRRLDTDLNQDVRCSGCLIGLARAEGGPHPKGIGSQILVPFAPGSPACRVQGLVGEVLGVRPYRTGRFFHLCPTGPGSCIQQRNQRCQRNQTSEEDRSKPQRERDKKQKRERKRERLQARGGNQE